MKMKDCDNKKRKKIGYIDDISNINWYRYDFSYRKLVGQKIEKILKTIAEI